MDEHLEKLALLLLTCEYTNWEKNDQVHGMLSCIQ